MPLIIVPTPIGYLEDMTMRGLRALREADVIACEDTRRTLGLLNHFEIKKPLISCHEYNEAERVETIVKWLENGETVALVSDAGTPGISDPGFLLVRRWFKSRSRLDDDRRWNTLSSRDFVRCHHRLS